MAHKKSKAYSAGSWILLVAVIGAIFVVNFFSSNSFTRFDFTKNKKFTLSKSTKDILAGLPDMVTVKAVYSSNIPNPINQYTQEVKDLLNEYIVYGKGMIDLQIVDPVGDSDLQDELNKIGINPVQVPVQSLDQVSNIKIYASIYIQYLDKSEIIPFAVQTENLEYDLTTAIARITVENVARVGFLNVDEGREIFKEFSKLKGEIAKSYEVVEVTKEDISPIDEKIKILMVLSPFSIDERSLYEVDQFIMRGGSVIFLTEGVRIWLQPGQFGTPMPFYAMAQRPDMDALGNLLAKYGVKRNYDLVMDDPHQEYPILGPLGTPYPLFPIIDTRSETPSEHPITTGLDYLLFTWASSVEIMELPESVRGTDLVVTSDQSWVQQGQNMIVDPNGQIPPPLPVPGMGPAKRTLAALLSGEFASAYPKENIPPLDGGVEPAGAPEHLEKSVNTNIMVVGCSKFVSNEVPVQTTPNMYFVVGAVEWMAGGQNLADIKKRNVAAPPVGDLELEQVYLVGFVFPFMAPLFIICFGIVRYVVKKKRKNDFLGSV
jgi:gliding motility-associatede transport system auxiliary component